MTVEAFLSAIPLDTRRDEARRLDAIFRAATGWEPWLSGRVVGYGRYGYRYGSGRSGSSFATGFAPAGRRLSLHILPGYADFPDIAERLGRHARGKSCWYLHRLDDADPVALRDLIRAGLENLDTHWPVKPT